MAYGKHDEGLIESPTDTRKSHGDAFEVLREEYAAVRREMKYLAAQNESIFIELSQKIAELSAMLQGGGARIPESMPARHGGAPLRAEIDYDKLAKKIIEVLPAQEVISPDYIASKISEQIVIPERGYSSDQSYRRNEPVAAEISEDELADKISRRIGAVSASDFDILVDDDGCASISKVIAEKMNYDAISATLAEKLRSALDLAYSAEGNYEEMASHLAEKFSNLSEEGIADKAAAALADHLPEIDPDEIADKVASQVISMLPSFDNEAISKSISEHLIDTQANRDYDIVIDEEGLKRITSGVTEEVFKDIGGRIDALEREIAQLKAMVLAGAVISSQPQEESYVTVSQLVEGEDTDGGDEVMEEIVSGIDEIPSEGEIMPDGLGGVDFANMMKYNRSFISRIIQGSDEQKRYYGEVKTALLSYAKVNSNVAWGSERFNKGRETIARLKIRGKTLCLYLALDPAEYKASVYHHVDVSDNKSMHGTPMMVKIKSPLGVKKAVRLIDEMLSKRGGVKKNVQSRDYAAMYPYETIEELIEDGLVKDISKGS